MRIYSKDGSVAVSCPRSDRLFNVCWGKLTTDNGIGPALREAKVYGTSEDDAYAFVLNAIGAI